MSLYIYIDDTRKPIFTDCIWAKDYEGAITAVENNAKDNHLIYRRFQGSLYVPGRT